jgi:hypothetical protein
MACISTGYTRGCTNSIGAIKKAWAVETSSVVSMTKTGSKYATITMATTPNDVFYDLDPLNGQFLRTKTQGKQRGTYDVQVTLNYNQVNQELRDIAEDLGSCCSLTLIVQDNDGQNWVVGFLGLTSAAMGPDDGAHLDENTLDTSADRPAGQMAKLVFKCMAAEAPRQYTGTVPV